MHKVLKVLKKNPNAGLFQNCADDKLSQSYEETVSICGHSSKDINVCPDITKCEFRSEIGYNFYLFGVRYQNRFSAPPLMKVFFGVTTEIGDSIYGGFALVLKY